MLRVWIFFYFHPWVFNFPSSRNEKNEQEMKKMNKKKARIFLNLQFRERSFNIDRD